MSVENIPPEVRDLLRAFARPTLLTGRERPDEVLLMPITARDMRAIQDYLEVEYAYPQPELNDWIPPQ